MTSAVGVVVVIRRLQSQVVVSVVLILACDL
jgi:hypothetical protein